MAIGQCFTISGDPVRGPLQWNSFPRAISVEFPYVVALLRSNVIDIYNIHEQRFVQQVPLSSKSKTISTGPGIKVQVAGLIDRLKLENGCLLNNSHLDDNTSSNVDASQQSNQPNFLATVPTRLIIAGSESVVALAATPFAVKVRPCYLINYFLLYGEF